MFIILYQMWTYSTLYLYLAMVSDSLWSWWTTRRDPGLWWRIIWACTQRLGRCLAPGRYSVSVSRMGLLGSCGLTRPDEPLKEEYEIRPAIDPQALELQERRDFPRFSDLPALNNLASFNWCHCLGLARGPNFSSVSAQNLHIHKHVGTENSVALDI